MIGKTRYIFVVFILVGCILLAGCTSSPPAKESITPSPTPTPTTLPETPKETPAPTPASEPSLFDGPVTEPPAELEVSVSAQKDPVYNVITVTFNGGKGQQLLKSLLVKVTTFDGVVTELPLATNQGAEVEVQGTKGADRVQVAADYLNGQSYLIFDQTFGKTRPDITMAIPISTTVPESSSGGMYDGPVTQPPNNLVVLVDVDKDPVYRVITATFRGGHGQSLVKSIQVHGVLSDGKEVTEDLGNNIGSIAEIQGTSGNDKIQVVVFYKNGEQYKISEKVFGPRG